MGNKETFAYGCVVAGLFFVGRGTDESPVGIVSN